MGHNDEVTGLHVMSTRANLVLRSQGKTIGTTFDADVHPFRAAHGACHRRFHPAARQCPVRGKATFTGLDLRGLGANAAMFSGVKNIPVVLSASTQFRMQSTGRIEEAEFDITARGEIPYAAMKSKALHINTCGWWDVMTAPQTNLALNTADLDAKEARAR
jgi:hypothetical protein